jgi:hypothetical protein
MATGTELEVSPIRSVCIKKGDVACRCMAQMVPEKLGHHSPIGRGAVVRLNGKSRFHNWTYFGLTREILSVEPDGLQCVE